MSRNYNIKLGASAMATSLIIDGASGDGFIQIPAQASQPSTPAGAVSLFTDTSDRLSWVDPTGFKSTIDTSAITADRVWELPDKSGEFVTGDDNRLSTPQIVNVKNSNPGPGEFTTIESALASITDASTTKRYAIHVGPGVYVENALIHKQFVTLQGSGITNTIIVPSSNTITQLTMSSDSTAFDMLFSGLYGGVSDKAIVINGGINIGINRVIMQNFHTLIYIHAATAPVNTLITQCIAKNVFNVGFHVDGRLVHGTNECFVNMSNNIMYCDAVTEQSVRIEGPYADTTSSTSLITDAVAGTGIHIEDGSIVNVTNCQLNNLNIGIVTDNVGAGPVLRVASTTLFNNITNDICVAHPSTTGVFSGITDRTKVDVDASAIMSTLFTDPNNGGSVISGALHYGRFSLEDTAEIGTLLSLTSPIGDICQGGSVTVNSGLDIDVVGSTGYVLLGIYPNETLKKISWATTTVSLSANNTHYVYVNEFGVSTSLALPSIKTVIMLARVRTHATGIEFIDNQIIRSHNWHGRLIDKERQLIGVLYAHGSQTSANASRELSISSGHYYYLNNEFNPSGAVSPAQWYAYYHSGGVFTRVSQTVVSNTQYDNLTDLTAIPAGKYVKHVLYIINEGVNEQYFLVYGQELFNDQASAETGNEPNPPTYFNEGVAPIAAIIVQEGQSSVQLIIDIRPTPISGAGGSATVSSAHGDLSGLGNDDHLQYLLVNGTRAMIGDLNMGTKNIVSAGTFNDVAVDTHASRHLPNGADALTSAAPLITLINTTPNAVGTANSFARSDHTHAIDISGFSVNGLSGTMSVGNGGTGATTHTIGNFLTGNGTSAVVSTKVVPTGDVVGISDAQTLTNKTIIGGTVGNDIAANKVLGVTVSATPPAADELIIATGATAAAWAKITDSNFSGALAVPHGGTGLSTLTASRFLVGNNASTVDLTKVVPTGSVVGTSDIQVLTNKTLSSATNTVDATKLQTVNVVSTTPTNRQVLTYNLSNTRWEPTTPPQKWIIKDIKTVGTGGGSITLNTWTTRDLNTLTGSADTSVTLAANQITFTAGTYLINAAAPAARVGEHKARLRNITAGSDICYGSSSSNATNNDATTISTISEYVTFGVTTVAEVQHISTGTRATVGLGVATNIATTNEIYTVVNIEKIN